MNRTRKSAEKELGKGLNTPTGSRQPPRTEAEAQRAEMKIAGRMPALQNKSPDKESGHNFLQGEFYERNNFLVKIKIHKNKSNGYESLRGSGVCTGCVNWSKNL
jgi:hypothetical protein